MVRKMVRDISVGNTHLLKCSPRKSMFFMGPITVKKALPFTADISRKLYDTAIASRVRRRPEYAKLEGSVI